MPPVRPGAGYAGVLCLNPACGKPIDLDGLWPETPGGADATALRAIVTLECPHCERRSTYCPKDLQIFDGQRHEHWRAEPALEPGSLAASSTGQPATTSCDAATTSPAPSRVDADRFRAHLRGGSERGRSAHSSFEGPMSDNDHSRRTVPSGELAN